MSEDETRAADAVAALQALTTERMEYKADVATAVLDIDNRDVTTLFSVDNLDDGGDIAEVKAFKRTIEHRKEKIPHIFMHDLRSPAIARILDFQPLRRAELPTDVQQAYPEATGGWACVSRYLKTGHGATVFDGITQGIAYGASIGYRPLKVVRETMPDGRAVRRIKELQLFEVSTTHPGHSMNPATRTRLNKAALDALDAINEIKAGWRHGNHADIAALREVYTITCDLLGIPSVFAEPAPLVMPARTSEVDEFLADIDSFLEVST